MGSRNINAVITPNTIALNAFIYGYGGHSMVTPHTALQQIWWTQKRIEEKVTRDFVVSRIKIAQRPLLDEPLGFGDGLTSDTYMDWILEKSRRMFLILAEIGVPDNIFGIIDASWDDEDLPLPMDTVQRLSITYQMHEQLDRKFYDTQFKFLLRELDEGSHVDYGASEVIPLEYVHRLPPAVSLQGWNKVHLPKKPHVLFMRRKSQLGEGPSKISQEEFIADVENARFVEHEHIAPIYASYTWKGNAYALSSFVGEHTLKTFIDHRTAPQFMRLSKHDRYALLLEWLHCLSSAVASLHLNGFNHSAIRPSNIIIDSNNRIAFSDIGSLATFQKDKKPDITEAYNYSAPEYHSSSLSLLLKSNSKSSHSSRGGSVSSKDSSEKSLSSGSFRSHSKKIKSHLHLPKGSPASFDFGFTPNVAKKRAQPTKGSGPSDIFALGCIFLDILTFLLKKKASDFTRHRSTKVKEGGRGSTSRTDSSFHSNPDKLETWMSLLDNLAFEQEDDLFRCVPHVLRLVRDMVALDPSQRPSATIARDRVYDMLISYGGMKTPHCSIHQNDVPKIPQTAAQEFQGYSKSSLRTKVKSVSPTETLVADGSMLQPPTSSAKIMALEDDSIETSMRGIAI